MTRDINGWKKSIDYSATSNVVTTWRKNSWKIHLIKSSGYNYLITLDGIPQKSFKAKNINRAKLFVEGWLRRYV